MKKIRIYLCCLFLAGKSYAAVTIDVTKYGAVGDATTLNTAALQKAIDDCSAQGGGKVVFPAGTWLSGTLLLKTGVTLYLDEKATLLGSPDIANYQVVDGFKDGLGQEMGYSFIGAVDVQHVGIEGLGTIDGQGKLVRESGGKNRRPFLVRFVRCSDVTVKEVRLMGPTAWTLHFFRCKNILAERVVIRSRGLGNNDGIDIDCCEDMVIRNCDIDSGDDAICFKTTAPYPCRNVTVQNVHIFTREGAVKFGTESAGNFENITVKEVQVMYAREGGIKLFSVDGSHMRNIRISDITMYKVHLPVIVRLGARLKTFREGDPKLATGSINDVQISNVKVWDGDVVGILISGVPGYPVEGLTMENIDIQVAGGGTRDMAAVQLEEKEAAYPEIGMFGKSIPAYGLYMRHAKNIRLKNIQLHTVQPDERPAVITQDVEAIELAGWQLPVNTAAATPLLRMGAARDAVLSGFVPSARPAVFLQVAGKESKNIQLFNNQRINTATAVVQEMEVEKNAVIVR